MFPITDFNVQLLSDLFNLRETEKNYTFHTKTNFLYSELSVSDVTNILGSQNHYSGLFR